MTPSRPFTRPELRRLAEACWYAERDRDAAVNSIAGVINGKAARDHKVFRALRLKLDAMLAGEKRERKK